MSLEEKVQNLEASINTLNSSVNQIDWKNSIHSFLGQIMPLYQSPHEQDRKSVERFLHSETLKGTLYSIMDKGDFKELKSYERSCVYLLTGRILERERQDIQNQASKKKKSKEQQQKDERKILRKRLKLYERAQEDLSNEELYETALSLDIPRTYLSLSYKHDDPQKQCEYAKKALDLFEENQKIKDKDGNNPIELFEKTSCYRQLTLCSSNPSKKRKWMNKWEESCLRLLEIRNKVERRYRAHKLTADMYRYKFRLFEDDDASDNAVLYYSQAKEILYRCKDLDDLSKQKKHRKIDEKLQEIKSKKNK